MKYCCLALGAIFFAALNLSVHASDPITIAIIDDGFNVDHSRFSGLIWRNQDEIPNNGIDDDQNGFIDDWRGVDVADIDNDVKPPAHDSERFYHGSHVAGILVNTLNKHSSFEDKFELMLIKAVSDTSDTMLVEHGYKGIGYAVENGADIISLSWSGGRFDNQAAQSLANAQKQGVLVIASAGSYLQPEPAFPSAHESVIGVGGVDQDGVLLASNVGEEVELLAYSGELESVASSGRQDLSLTKPGSSNAVPVVAAASALLKAEFPQLDNWQIIHCLKSTAVPVNSKNPLWSGKLGAGKVQIDKAMSCANQLSSANKVSQTPLLQSEASLYFKNSRSSKGHTRQWQIQPRGQYQGLKLMPWVIGKPAKSELTISQIGKPSRIYWQGSLLDVPPVIEADESNVEVTLVSKTRAEFEFRAEYQTQNIVLSERFCKDEIVVTESTVVTDGSGVSEYAALSNCKWLIKPPEQHDVKIRFLSVDTEEHVDGVHVFYGDQTTNTSLLLKVTGNKVPPEFILEDSPALIWFVSDEKNQGQGFEIEVTMLPK